MQLVVAWFMWDSQYVLWSVGHMLCGPLVLVGLKRKKSRSENIESPLEKWVVPDRCTSNITLVWCEQSSSDGIYHSNAKMPQQHFSKRLPILMSLLPMKSSLKVLLKNQWNITTSMRFNHLSWYHRVKTFRGKKCDLWQALWYYHISFHSSTNVYCNPIASSDKRIRRCWLIALLQVKINFPMIKAFL